MAGLISVRMAASSDLFAILDVHRAAFPTSAEARLVELLVQSGQDCVSLVAEEGDAIVGHLLFSPVSLEGDSDSLERELDNSPVAGLGLAPLAVQPEFQRRGIGSQLVRSGLDECRRFGADFAVVLGDPQYYGRFGFQPARLSRLVSEYDAGDAFQVVELRTGCLAEIRQGRVHYAAEFASLEEDAASEP